MDKFGIFNILGSLLGQTGAPADGKTADAPTFSPPQYTAASETVQAEKRASLPPLQSAMLTTMQSHEEFVKRVRAKNPAPAQTPPT